jgi:hypothetical protein
MSGSRGGSISPTTGSRNFPEASTRAARQLTVTYREAGHVGIGDPQSRHGDSCDRSPPLERDHGWRRAAGRWQNCRDRHLPGTQPQAPERRGCRQRQGGDVAGVCQWSPSHRVDTGAARLTRHAARVMVRHPLGHAERQPLPRYSLFGVRDDRVGCHDGSASAWSAPRKTRSGGAGLRRGDPRLLGCRDACFLLVRGARPEPPGLPAGRRLHCQPAVRTARSDAAMVRAFSINAQ